MNNSYDYITSNVDTRYDEDETSLSILSPIAVIQCQTKESQSRLLHAAHEKEKVNDDSRPVSTKLQKRAVLLLAPAVSSKTKTGS